MSIEFFEDQKLSPEEQALSSRKALRVLGPMIARHKRGLAVAFVLLALATLISLYWPILLKRAFDVDLANKDFRGLVVTTIGIIALQGMNLLFQYFQRIKLETVGQEVMTELKQKLFRHILSLDVPFFDRNPVGKLMARVESDAESLRQLFTMTAVVIAGDLLLVTGTFAVMLYYSWRLSLILITIVPVLLIMIVIFERITTPRFLEVRKKVAEMVATLTEFLHGMAIVQIFNREAYARHRMNEANWAAFRPDRFGSLAVTIFFNIISFTQYLMIGLVLLFGIAWARQGLVSVGTLSMFIILIWRAYEPIYRTSEQLSTIQRAIAGAKRMHALLNAKPRLIDTEHPVSWPALREGIRFENVWFSYNEDESYQLKDVSFDLPVGKRIALVGVTGGGKSTVINLLLRFYDPQRGRILVDGIDIRTITQQELRRRFALVLQDIFLFPGDVRSNIVLEEAGRTDEEVRVAAQTVDAHRFIERLPKQYATEVSEKGSNFSRGERQLLSFARALVVNPDLLILDEATSSVDPETERSIQEALKRLMAGRTSLVIAHRLTTILDVDEILVIRRGEIIERGTHTELLLQNGYYSRLFHLQFKSKNGLATNA